MDFYAASSWQPDAKPLKSCIIQSPAFPKQNPLESPAFMSEQSESLTKALKEAFSEIVQLKSSAKQTEPNLKILQDRCKTLSTWAEQYRIANVKHEQTIKGHSETVKGLEKALMNVDSAYTKLKAHNANLLSELSSSEPNSTEVVSLKTELSRLKQENASLKSAQHSEILKLQSEVLKANHNTSSFLASAPVNPELMKKACNVLSSATGILSLAAKSQAEPHLIKSYLADVGVALSDLGVELKEHEHEARGWLKK
jgi:myosin heavy subunit